jgi:sugar phosphate isomerase/epimerase
MVHAGDNLGERDDHLPPGEGAIGWAGFAAALRRAGFEGMLMLELSAVEARNGAGGLRGLLQRAAAARDMLRAL